MITGSFKDLNLSLLLHTMFIKNNSLKSIFEYFAERLKNNYSEREIQLIAKSFIAKRLEVGASELMTDAGRRVSESDILYFKKVTRQMRQGLPFQYALGETYFYNISLRSDARALIPRPETEELVNWVVEDNRGSNNLEIIDIGTGTGCIALSLKKALKGANITGIDRSIEALSLARENASDLNLEVDFKECDILNFEKYTLPDNLDIIVSNPPYIPHSEKSEMHENVLDHEPGMALFTDNDTPLIFYERIVDFGMKHLKKDGVIYFEINENRGDDLKSLLNKKGCKDIQLRKDLQDKDRMIKCTI